MDYYYSGEGFEIHYSPLAKAYILVQDDEVQTFHTPCELPDYIPEHVLSTIKDAQDYTATKGEQLTIQNLLQADTITSELIPHGEEAPHLYHRPILDLDFPVHVLPSSTEGHSHLYLDRILTKEAYFKLLETLAELEIIEHGYLSASQDRGYTSVRLPWIQKKDETNAN